MVDCDSWLFVHDSAVHRRLTGYHGYHVVSASQETVTLDWNVLFNHHWSFVPPDEVSLLTGAYLLKNRAFHPPVAFAGLGNVPELVPLHAFVPWFDEGVITERPE